MESYEEQLEVATRNGRRDLTELGKTELRPEKKKIFRCGLGPLEVATSL